MEYLKQALEHSKNLSNISAPMAEAEKAVSEERIGRPPWKAGRAAEGAQGALICRCEEEEADSRKVTLRFAVLATPFDFQGSRGSV